MQILIKQITKKELREIAEHGFGDMVKAVVDIEKEIIAIDAELHSDLEAFCLDKGSNQLHLWGINYYPTMEEDFIEFDSMINLRPGQGNRTRSVDDDSIKKIIIDISNKWITRNK